MDEKICQKCGSKNESSSAFCGQCGTPMGNPAQSSPPPMPSMPPPVPQQPPRLGQTSITIQRPSQFASVRTYKIFLDNVEILAVKNGETKTVPVKPGSHSIFAKVEPLRSLTIQFTIAESENKLFSAHPSPPLPTSTILLKGLTPALMTSKPGEVVTLELLN